MASCENKLSQFPFLTGCSNTQFAVPILNYESGTYQNYNIDFADLLCLIDTSGDTYVNDVQLSGDTLIISRNDGVSFFTDLSSLRFTGNTSGNCINELAVKNLYGCSPITIHTQFQVAGTTSGAKLSMSSGYGCQAGDITDTYDNGGTYYDGDTGIANIDVANLYKFTVGDTVNFFHGSDNTQYGDNEIIWVGLVNTGLTASGFQQAGGFNDKPYVLYEFNNELYCGNPNSNLSWTTIGGIVKWDDVSSWTMVGRGFSHTMMGVPYIITLCEYNNDLWIGGMFDFSSDFTIPNYTNVSRFNSGTGEWDVINGFNSVVNTLCVFNGELYAGGSFTTDQSATQTLNYIAKWDDGLSTWVQLSGFNGTVYCLTDFGGELYACGTFTGDDVGGSINRVAKFDVGADRWVEVGGGLSNAPYDMVVHDGELYIGGGFQTDILGNPLNYIAKLDVIGNQWKKFDSNPVEGGFDSDVTSIYSDGSYLYATGNFTRAVGAGFLFKLARLNGTTWDVPDRGNFNDGFNGGTTCIIRYRGDLFVGGGFTQDVNWTIPMAKIAKNSVTFSYDCGGLQFLVQPSSDYDDVGGYVSIGGDYSDAEGYNSYSIGLASHAEGFQTKSYGDYSHSEGEETISSGMSSHSEGRNTQSLGWASHAEGTGTKTYGWYAHTEGNQTIGAGKYSHSEGQTTQSIGVASHAEGINSISNGDYSHSEGASGTADGVCSHNEGFQTQTIGQASHAEGILAQSHGDNSHAEGHSCYSLGNASHAEGQGTRSFARQSHSEGSTTSSYGDFSHSEGYLTISSGSSSHAEGYNTISLGNYSHSEGGNTVSYGLYSHVGGYSFEPALNPVTTYGFASFNHSVRNDNTPTVYGSYGNYTFILGGQDNSAKAFQSGVLGGSGNTVNDAHTSSVIIGCTDTTSRSGNTIYGPSFESVIPGEGIILTSPSGLKFRISISNGGAIVIDGV